jgi:hypothetical protein
MLVILSEAFFSGVEGPAVALAFVCFYNNAIEPDQ